MIDITKAETRKMTRALTAFILLLSAVISSAGLEALAHRGLVEADAANALKGDFSRSLVNSSINGGEDNAFDDIAQQFWPNHAALQRMKAIYLDESENPAALSVGADMPAKVGRVLRYAHQAAGSNQAPGPGMNTAAGEVNANVLGAFAKQAMDGQALAASPGCPGRSHGSSYGSCQRSC